MYRYDEIRVLHLELTARCNAACAMCPRNIQGGQVNPNLPLSELSLADVRAIFPDDFIRRLRRMYMCGNYGDAMVAKDVVPVFEHFRAVHPGIDLRLTTNASGRTADWWARLAKVVDRCIFSIDGLEDTNSIYRRRTKWRLVMRAVEAFIGAGGRAEWEFLVFRHNEHQVEAAAALSPRLGFKKFTPKRTERFLVNGRLVPEKPVQDGRGQAAYAISMPSDPRYHNAATVGVAALADRGTTYRSYAEQTGVSCKAVGEHKIFASAEGLIFPCCWVGGLYSSGLKAEAGEVWKLIHRLPEGKHSQDARRHSLREIVEGPLFCAAVPDTWVPGSPARREFTLCARTCGQYDAMQAVPAPALFSGVAHG
ncbi:MAG: radical SAM protein [Deltaproteobacteria bacterium]|nr:radical SAM protein [Deltaproteobacteria bacterium]